MQQRSLGQGGPQVSALGYGAMSFSNFYGPMDEAGSVKILDACQHLGITHLDTADVYGSGFSEACIGAYFRANPSAADRFSVATKAAIYRSPEGVRSHRNDAAYLTQQLDQSLARLSVEAIDLFYVHRRDPETPIEEVTETLAGFIKAGKIKGFGYSEIAPTSLQRANEVHHVMAVQSEYSLGVRSPEMGLIQSCKSLGTAFVAFSPVGRSLLTDKPHQGDKLKEVSFLQNNPRFMEPNLSANIKATAPFRALAADIGLTAAGLAIAWALDQDDHIIPIPGTRSVTHLEGLAAGATFTMTDEVRDALAEILPIGWTHGDRYSLAQWVGPEKYC